MRSCRALREEWPQVPQAECGVGQRLSLLWILLGLEHHPAGVVPQLVKHAIEGHATITGNREYPLHDRVQEAPVLASGPCRDLRAHILRVEVADPRGVAPCQPDRVCSRKPRVTR